MKSGYYALLSLRDQGVIKAIGGGINEWQVCEALARRGDFDLFLLAGAAFNLVVAFAGIRNASCRSDTSARPR